MSGDPLRGNGHLVDSLGNALRSGEHGLSTVPDLLKRVLKEGTWREFVTSRGEHVAHDRFAEFVVTPPLKGLGATVDLIRRIVAPDTEAADMLDGALQNPIGTNQHGNNVTTLPKGNSQDRALRKLRKDAPELHADVLADRISAHAAMVKAGFRPRTFTVRADDPRRIAATLQRQLDAETLAVVAQLLTEEASNGS